ncbi:hypothetical protein P8452_01562 [Trifolium repens]|nr:hypothetical protein P8452_01562 [Trifolium repens]
MKSLHEIFDPPFFLLNFTNLLISTTIGTETLDCLNLVVLLLEWYIYAWVQVEHSLYAENIWDRAAFKWIYRSWRSVAVFSQKNLSPVYMFERHRRMVLSWRNGGTVILSQIDRLSKQGPGWS